MYCFTRVVRPGGRGPPGRAHGRAVDGTPGMHVIGSRGTIEVLARSHMNKGERDRRYGYPLPRLEARMSAKTTFQTKATQLL